MERKYLKHIFLKLVVCKIIAFLVNGPNLIKSVAYAEICEGGFETKKTIALSGPGNGQKLQKLGLHSKTKCYAFKNILQ